MAAFYYPFDVYICTHFIRLHMVKRSVYDYEWTHTHTTHSEWASWIVSLNYFSLWANFFSLLLWTLLLFYLSFVSVMMIYKNIYPSLLYMWMCYMDTDGSWVDDMFGIYFLPKNIFLLFHIFSHIIPYNSHSNDFQAFICFTVSYIRTLLNLTTTTTTSIISSAIAHSLFRKREDQKKNRTNEKKNMSFFISYFIQNSYLVTH